MPRIKQQQQKQETFYSILFSILNCVEIVQSIEQPTEMKKKYLGKFSELPNCF